MPFALCAIVPKIPEDSPVERPFCISFTFAFFALPGASTFQLFVRAALKRFHTTAMTLVLLRGETSYFLAGSSPLPHRKTPRGEKRGPRNHPGKFPMRFLPHPASYFADRDMMPPSPAKNNLMMGLPWICSSLTCLKYAWETS